MEPVKKITKLIKKERCSRCSMEGCKKKLGVVKFTCNCGKNYCTTHKLAESHNCTYDFIEEGKKMLEEKNPVVIKAKIIKI
jgi:hypothetical protein